jgi:hypothetical protein
MDDLGLAICLVQPGEDQDVVADREIAAASRTSSSKTIQASGAPSLPCIGASSRRVGDDWARPTA